MNAAVLVTGASGFIGREVVRRLVDRGVVVTAFSRGRGPDLTQVTSVQGDLLDPESLDRALEGVGSVIHLAAATGKASAAEMRRTNVDGVHAVLDACRRSGVSRLIHVSTIAVNYTDLRDYPYAQSKRDAEQLVIASDLDWTVVRPTIVLGPDAPALGPLRGLAAGPVLMAPGGGNVAVQPIDVRDVAASLVELVTSTRAIGSVVELGGPTVLSMRALLTRLREHAGKGRGPVLSIPLWLLRTVARVATTVLGDRSPVTPGQLTAFRFDSTAKSTSSGSLTPMQHDIASMIEGS